jgi:hypothetical protein
VYRREGAEAGRRPFSNRTGSSNEGQKFGWIDLVPHDATGLVSFERKEKILAGNTGERWLVCTYVVNDAGHADARGQLSYQDVATH